MRRAIAFALALALVPGAAGGTEEDPEVVDGRDGRTPPHLDLLRAWLEPAPGGILFTVEVVAIEEAVPNAFYGISFVANATRYAAVVMVADDGSLRTDIRRSPPSWSQQGVVGSQGLRNTLRDPDVETGDGGRVSAVIPFNVVPGVSQGRTLIDIGAFTGYWDTDDLQWEDEDAEETGRTYSVKDTWVPVFVTRNKTTILVSALIGLTLVGAGIGFVAWRIVRRRHGG